MAADASVTAVDRIRSLRSLAVGAGAASSIAIFGFASGGYYPTAWGWGALVALWLVATYLVMGAATRPAPLALTMLGGLALLTAWTWLSLLWSDDVDQTVLEGQRTLLYVAVAAALVLVVRRVDVEPLLGGTLIGIFLPAGYGLLTRLFPDRIGVFDPIAGYRLQEPIGYWNALGLFAAMGAALALGFAARGSLLVRALAGASLPILLATTYFTFSRGAWLALGVGLVVAVAIDPRRLHLLAVALVVAPASGLAVWLASRQDALTRTDAPLSAATDEGHRLALYLLVLAGLSALAAAAFGFAERRVTLPRAVPLAFAGALALIVVAGSITVFARYGGPHTIVQKGWDSFAATPAPNQADLRERLFTFTGSYRVDLWRVALDEYDDHPVVGSGAGSYEHYWNEHRPFAHNVRDAHSLYLEVLAELGPLGLALLVLALGVPLVGAFFARGHPLVPAAARGLRRLSRPCRRGLGLGAAGGHHRRTHLRDRDRRGRRARRGPVACDAHAVGRRRSRACCGRRSLRRARRRQRALGQPGCSRPRPLGEGRGRGTKGSPLVALVAGAVAATRRGAARCRRHELRSRELPQGRLEGPPRLAPLVPARLGHRGRRGPTGDRGGGAAQPVLPRRRGGGNAQCFGLIPYGIPSR